MTAKAAPTLTWAMTIPATAGPRKRALLKMIALIARAEGSAARSTRVGISARREGWAIALKTPSSKVKREQQLDRDRAGIDQDGEQGRLDAAGDLRHPDDADPVAPVGESAGERAEEHDREELGHRHDAEPGAGMGQGPGEPADRDPLHPDADQRDGIAAGVDAVIAVGEGEDDIAEPARKQAIADEASGQEPKCETRNGGAEGARSYRLLQFRRNAALWYTFV